LFICAKDLFVEAMAHVADGLANQPQQEAEGRLLAKFDRCSPGTTR
jgi:hypothetical protein